MPIDDMKLCFKKQGGFSLIELSVVIILFGIAAGIVSTEYKHYTNIKANNDTQARRDLIKQALSRYLVFWGGLPCPASPSLPPEDPEAGRANCKMGDITVYPYNTWPVCDTLSSGSHPATNLCVVAGARPSTTGDNPSFCSSYTTSCSSATYGTVAPRSAAYNDPVLIGTIPYIDLGLALNDSIDGWGNRMTYAVTYYMTYDPANPAPKFNRDDGVINAEYYDTTTNTILPKYNTNTSQGPANPIAKAFMLAIVSHGPDGKGAWTYEGLRPKPCDRAPIDMGASASSPLSTGRDNENCNGDATFLADDNNTLHSLVAGPYYYDDAFVQTDISLYADKWMAPSQPNLVQNAAGGSIGIGTANPTNLPTNDIARSMGPVLDVSGNIRANNYQASNFCDKATGNCFNQALFFGNPADPSANSCGDSMMTGVANSRPQPATQVDTSAGVVTFTCPANEYAYAIDLNGNIQCQNLP